MSLSVTSEERSGRNDVSRILRIVSICTFIPALAFNIAHGVTSRQMLPAFGLIPHAISVAVAIYDLEWLKRLIQEPQYSIVLHDDEGDDKKSNRKLIITLFDIGLALSLLGCVIGGYILISRSWYCSGYSYYYFSCVPGQILGTWATVPYIVNILIHTFFVLKALQDVWKRCSKSPATCPHCHGSLHGHSPAAQQSAAGPATKPTAERV